MSWHCGLGSYLKVVAPFMTQVHPSGRIVSEKLPKPCWNLLEMGLSNHFIVGKGIPVPTGQIVMNGRERVSRIEMVLRYGTFAVGRI